MAGWKPAARGGGALHCSGHILGNVPKCLPAVRADWSPELPAARQGWPCPCRLGHASGEPGDGGEAGGEAKERRSGRWGTCCFSVCCLQPLPVEGSGSLRAGVTCAENRAGTQGSMGDGRHAGAASGPRQVPPRCVGGCARLSVFLHRSHSETGRLSAAVGSCGGIISFFRITGVVARQVLMRTGVQELASLSPSTVCNFLVVCGCCICFRVT